MARRKQTAPKPIQLPPVNLYRSGLRDPRTGRYWNLGLGGHGFAYRVGSEVNCGGIMTCCHCWQTKPGWQWVEERYLPRCMGGVAAILAANPGRSRCGYCDRELTPTADGGWECPRCAPLLSDLGAGRPFPEMVAEFARFQRDAVKS